MRIHENLRLPLLQWYLHFVNSSGCKKTGLRLYQDIQTEDPKLNALRPELTIQEFEVYNKSSSTTSWGHNPISIARSFLDPVRFARHVLLFHAFSIVSPLPRWHLSLMEDACHSVSEGDSACLVFNEITFLWHASHQVLGSHCQPLRVIHQVNPLQLSSRVCCRFALTGDLGPLDLKLENMPRFLVEVPPRDAAP